MTDFDRLIHVPTVQIKKGSVWVKKYEMLDEGESPMQVLVLCEGGLFKRVAARVISSHSHSCILPNTTLWFSSKEAFVEEWEMTVDAP